MLENNKINRRGLIAIYVIASVNLLYFITAALLAYIMTSYSNLSPETVTLLVTVDNLVGIGVSLLMIPLSLKISKKILVGLIPICVFIYMMIFYFVGGDGPFWLLLLGAIISGYPQGAISAIGMAYISDYSTPETVGKNIALYTNLFNSIGIMVIFYLGGVIAAADGGVNWHNAYLLGLACIPATLIFFKLAPKYTPVEIAEGIGGADITGLANKGEQTKETFGKMIREIGELPKILIVMALLQFVFYMVISAFDQNISVYIIKEFSLGSSVEAGIASGIIRLMGVLCGLIYGLVNKTLKKWSVPFGYLLVALGLLIMSIWHTLTACYLAAFLCGFGNQYAFTTVYATGTIRAGAKYAGVATALIQSFVNFGTFATPYGLKYGALLLGEYTLINRLKFGSILGFLSAFLAIFVYVMYDKLKNKQLEVES